MAYDPPLLLIPALRPDGTLVWLPPCIAHRIGVAKGQHLTQAQWEDSELAALLNSRLAANKAKQHCTSDWHRTNGYN